MNSLNLRGLRACAWALGFLSASVPAQAQSVHDTVRNGLVFIEMKGITDNGVPMGSRGTGFFVSPDGYILTNHHLLEAISKVRPETVEIGISVWDRKEPPERKAFVVDARPNLDLMLLKVPRAQQPYKALKIGATQDDLSTVLVSGFIYRDNPPSAIYKRYTDQVTSTDGPAGYTWVLNTPAEAGQSGSPVYTSDGTVVGVLKGQFGNQTVFVPIEHATTLLLGVVKDWRPQ
jgi:serine protease Do